MSAAPPRRSTRNRRRGNPEAPVATRPPRLAAALLRGLLHGADRDYILGDLQEAYVQRAVQSRLRAAAWYWGQLPINLRASIRRRATPHRRAAAGDGDRGGNRFGAAATRRPRRSGHRFFGVLADARYALRGFRRTPGFTVVAVLTLALGIGANVAILSALNAVVLAPLPYPDSDAIVRVLPTYSLARGTMLAFEQRATSYSALSAYAGSDLTLAGAGEPTILHGTRVSPDHFDVMGVQPFLGRAFRAAERRPGGDDVVILSHALWRDRFGSDEAILGRSLPLHGGGHEARTVIGVMPPGYRPLLGGQRAFWIPLVADENDPDLYYGKFVRLVARLEPGVTVAQAGAEARLLAQALREGDADLLEAEEVEAARVATLHEETVGNMRRPLLILAAAAGFVLLVAGCNLVNLLLARSAERREEVAVRRALGAGRWRLARQMFVEAAVLGVAGGAFGLLAAGALDAVLVGFVPAGTPRAADIRLGWQVVALSLPASLLVGVLAGLLPAWQAAARQSSEQIRGNRASAGRGRRRFDNLVVVTEVAVSVVLITAAGLMMKSVWRLQRVDPGFEASGVASMLLSPSEASYPDGSRQAAYYESVLERVASLPGIEEAAMIHLSLMGGNNWMGGFLVEGRPLGEGGSSPAANVRSVTPGYFEAMRIPLLTGRTLSAGDREDSAPVVVINQALAREVWPAEDALGQRIYLSGEGPPYTVVGIVGDVRQRALDQPAAGEIYRTYRQWPVGSMHLLVRARGEPGDAVPAVKDAVWTVDARVPISDISVLQDAVRASVADFRFLGFLLAGFALLALVLGGVGVYGVMSYAVGRRLREFGVRMALGAAPQGIVRGAVVAGASVALAGIALGLLGALAATRLLRASLYEVSPTDPATFAVVAVFLVAVAGLANWLPARRAGRVDVIQALRGD